MGLLPRSIGALSGCAKQLGKSFCAAVGAVEPKAATDPFSLTSTPWTPPANQPPRNPAPRRKRESAELADEPVFYPQVEWKHFKGASSKDVRVERALGPADWTPGGLWGVEAIPWVNTGGVNLDVLSSNLELLRRMEESVLGIRTVALSCKRRKLDATDGGSGSDGEVERSPRSRVREICSKMGDLSDGLLFGLGKIGMANKELKPRLLKRTLDFGYVFREKAIQNVWHYVHDLGMSEEEVLRMLERDPLFASRSFSRSVGPKIRWLEGLGVDGGLVVHKWLARANKMLFRCSIAKLKGNYAWLQNLGLSKEECTRLLIQCPQILQKDIASLDEKLLFAILVLGKDIYDLVQWPTYFTYSFHNRIVLRTAFCCMSDIDFKGLAVSTLFGSSDAKFLLGKRNQLKVGDGSAEALLKSYADFKKTWAGMGESEKFAVVGVSKGGDSLKQQHGV